MDLIIVESPKKAKTIEKYLGKDYKVCASTGHICDLPEKRLGIDVDNDFAPEYEINARKQETVNQLRKEVDKARFVYLATDPDREGEAISWHLKNVLNLSDGEVRIEFNEITKNAVTRAIQNPRKINMSLVDAQQARRVLDRLVGYKISPILSGKIKGGLSAGRVQSVALKLIVDREHEIKNFVVEEYWNFYSMLSKMGSEVQFKAVFNDVDGKKYTIRDGETAAKLVETLTECKYTVTRVKRSVSKSHPSAPFTTSTLQQDGASKLKLTSPEIMKLAQQLYEGIDVPGWGHIALVTYIRTDSVRISSEAQQNCKDYILNNYGAAYVPEKYNYYKNKEAAQDAHEAIRPVSLSINPESLRDKIQRNQYRLYKLIFDRFVASQMTSAEFDTLLVDIGGHNDSNGRNYNFKVKGRSQRFDGFLKVYHTQQSDEDEQNAKLLPQFTEGEELILRKVVPEQKFTTPPPRFNDATIVREMEDCGIGRPSTYHTIIGVIQMREYVEKKEMGDKKDKVFVPSPLGEKVVEMLNQFFPDIMDVKFTAQMERNLDKVEEGIKWQQIIRDFYPNFNKEVLKARNDHSKMTMEAQVSDVKCSRCGAMMVIRDGKFGKFLACPNYPDCKNTRPIGEVVGICPKCGDNIIKKKNKMGKFYYGCCNYPDCKFTSFDVPAPFFCPDCGSTVKMVKRHDGVYFKCTNIACDYTHKEAKTDKPEPKE